MAHTNVLLLLERQKGARAAIPAISLSLLLKAKVPSDFQQEHSDREYYMYTASGPRSRETSDPPPALGDNTPEALASTTVPPRKHSAVADASRLLSSHRDPMLAGMRIRK